MKIAVPALIMMIISFPALADLQVRFIEGAPKDRFTMAVTGPCGLEAADVIIDLAKSPAGLIFDVTDRGAGVQVFQPMEFVTGREFVTALPQVADGDQKVMLHLAALKPGQEVSFTIDVDDTGNASPTMISGSEIIGAEIRVKSALGAATGVFDNQANALVMLSGCAS